jgi:hypothetical protein
MMTAGCSTVERVVYRPDINGAGHMLLRGRDIGMYASGHRGKDGGAEGAALI